MKKFTTIVLLLTFISSICFGEEPSVSSVKKGQIVPFNGVLYNYEADSIVQSEIDLIDKTCKVKTDFVSQTEKENCSILVKQSEVQLNTAQEIAKSRLDACNKDIKAMEELIKKPVAPIVTQDESSKKWWMVIGIAIGASIGAGSVYLSKKF